MLVSEKLTSGTTAIACATLEVNYKLVQQGSNKYSPARDQMLTMSKGIVSANCSMGNLKVLPHVPFLNPVFIFSEPQMLLSG